MSNAEMVQKRGLVFELSLCVTDPFGTRHKSYGNGVRADFYLPLDEAEELTVYDDAGRTYRVVGGGLKEV
jgi:hypothetical protein